MDSEVQRDGRILDLIDESWREDKLNDMDSLALEYLPENVPPTGRAGSFFVDGFLKITKIRSVFFQSPNADH
uniref:Anaphase-promoting complex subunit 13 n=1 Tax=Panthera leo TaxID=9689 RepID=A0A8C8Y4H4_PANLE